MGITVKTWYMQDVRTLTKQAILEKKKALASEKKKVQSE
jgi:hypothetical protein